MKKKDIKTGMGIVFFTAVICTAVIFTLAFLRNGKDAKEEKTEIAKVIVNDWADNLTNELSDVP